ncbi:MAG: tRNA (adenosine(37)-N6)-threonylcarbamoyltransferase complex ATPase subunit type 1 TsaE [Rickettsiaceae bacterium]|nr:tRNA (adenosine(37)-N6)-threonylcarbamoyltransferase complex ATPase subunit type 1 TsaE [Rickettsiaceae bacterium]MDP4832833.1 tRNA (adenosine(37)-N6)-threonylcarbamoyltransferase complex ATPase subunit type 1 TsaE [Rickettsiaceae bacterium]MDP5021124.1 tRNA (adenosine(37)-N6)-threonylcarbamoyltransferase complex ATPase subunit type 1 TsaE [Rickettsiaceae bacterium]MDP5082727.1 tRNA (adenosine(37)-N6)-threonylcarbamoyltransferase complex ATPase subunit type 1 TsaE [Rickettsiaceae bacterium]
MQNSVKIIGNEQDSILLAAQLADDIKPNDIITFSGDLGAGKTFLCREIIKNLCGQETQVISPTFNLLQIYDYTNCSIYHFDLYRLKHPSEIYELGIEEAFASHICLIEWPELINDLLPEDTTHINIEIISNTRRKITIKKV